MAAPVASSSTPNLGHLSIGGAPYGTREPAIDLTSSDDESDEFEEVSYTNNHSNRPPAMQSLTHAGNGGVRQQTPVNGPPSPFYRNHGNTVSTTHHIAAPSNLPRMQDDRSTVPSHPGSMQYNRPFAAPSTYLGPGRAPVQSVSGHHFNSRPSSSNPKQVIDLTGNAPLPPPSTVYRTPSSSMQQQLPPSLPPKTPVCIGQLTVTALVLYHLPYITQEGHSEPEWVSVRLEYEHNQHAKQPSTAETIHIKSPHARGRTGEIVPGEKFGIVEQRVSTTLGSMLGKGLIRLDGKVRKGPATLLILPLQMLVYTPKGNIPVVGRYLQGCGLFLDHPSTSFDVQRNVNYHYFNPHGPPPGGFAPSMTGQRPGGSFFSHGNTGRWNVTQVAGKSVEVQRSQVDELFKSMKGGEELHETQPAFEVATNLYPHQKKALTFLLERERERRCADGKYSSLWQHRPSPHSHTGSWFHMITSKEVFREPVESKGCILADDMGLGKTITCVSLIAHTLQASQEFAATPIELPPPPRDVAKKTPNLDPSHFAGSVWGMPETVASSSMSAKAKAKAAKELDRHTVEYARACRIKVKSRGTLIICPLSTVSNWEDQIRDHWRGEVHAVGGGSGVSAMPALTNGTSAISFSDQDVTPLNTGRPREGKSIRVYVYHGNARRPDPEYLSDFDVVITTYATLASEFSKQNRIIAALEAGDDDDDGSSDGGFGNVDFEDKNSQTAKTPNGKKGGTKRKKLCSSASESISALQSVHWFRVVLDEAHSIKETSTVASRACCDLMADRRLCLTGTPVQNKLDDVFALIKFLRLEPFDDKNVWTEFIGTPVKYGQALGVARLQTIMRCMTLRRTKESETADGKKILSLPPRRDEIRYLKFDSQEKDVYERFFNESKAEFNDMSKRNEVMKNYVGILQKILRLRQICDHFELVKGKGGGGDDPIPEAGGYEDIVGFISRDGLTLARANAIFSLLRESASTQCAECDFDLCVADPPQNDAAEMEVDGPPAAKRGRKPKVAGNVNSRTSTRPSTPAGPQPVLTRCQHLFCMGCFRDCVFPGWPNVAAETRRSCSACQTGLGPADAIEIQPDNLIVEPSAKKKPVKREKRQKGMPLDNFLPSTKINALLSDLLHFSKANPHSVNYDPISIDVQVTDGEGNAVNEGPTKTVVFSQWTTMLDKIEDALEIAGIRYDRLDGTMKRDERTRAMDALKHDPACEVLLVSLKAGGVGLNLTAAQRVYLMDPYWNPAVENQAVDRIHRLGQTRPVTTVKLIIENSIEARLLEVQKKKTELANMTLGSNFSKAELLQRRLDELNQLFGS